MCERGEKCILHFTPDFSVKNIKISVKINHNFDFAKVPAVNNLKKHFNFWVINSKYTYVIFNKSKKTGQTHVNITKLKNVFEIDQSVQFLFELFSIPCNIVHKLSIDNITSVGRFPQELDIPQFMRNNSDLKLSFNPEKFPGVFVKFPKGTIILFASGSGVIVGGKDVESSKKIVLQISQRLCQKCHVITPTQ